MPRPIRRFYNRDRLLMTMLYAGWAPDPERSHRIRNLLVLARGGTRIVPRDKVFSLTWHSPDGRHTAEVSATYRVLRFDPYDPFTLVDLPPGS